MTRPSQDVVSRSYLQSFKNFTSPVGNFVAGMGWITSKLLTVLLLHECRWIGHPIPDHGAIFLPLRIFIPLPNNQFSAIAGRKCPQSAACKRAYWSLFFYAYFLCLFQKVSCQSLGQKSCQNAADLKQEEFWQFDKNEPSYKEQKQTQLPDWSAPCITFAFFAHRIAKGFTQQ